MKNHYSYGIIYLIMRDLLYPKRLRFGDILYEIQTQFNSLPSRF